MSVKEFLQKLSEAHGVSGYEHALRDIVIEEFKPYANEITVTPMGSVIAHRRGKGTAPAPKVLIEGHIDEIGLMVTEIDHGFIRFTQVGGFDVRVLLAQQVIVHGKEPLPGIIGARPPHVLTTEDREKVIPMSDLWIDVGLPDARIRELVQVGDWITLDRKMITLKNNLVAGKAFDDRAAVACVALALKQLATTQHAWDVYAVANTQEEVGLKGAQTSTYRVNPDVAIAIDVGHADQPNVSDVDAVPINGGMGIAVGPNIHPLVFEHLCQLAKENEIPFKIDPQEGPTGTNAWAMQVVREGIPTGLIDIPLRYMHTSVETISLTDLERIGRLLALFCASLDDQFLKQLRGELIEETLVETRPKRKSKNTKRKSPRGRK